MKDGDKAKEQPLSELAEMRQRVPQFEASEVERMQTEKSPLLLDESYQRLFEFFPIGITVLDMKGVILYCNAAVYNKGSYSKDDLVGKHFSKIAPLRARDIPNFVRIFASLIRGKVPKPFEVNYQQKGGTTGWTEVSAGLIKIGEERRILVAQNDITERKQAEQTMSHERDLIQTIFENHPDFFYFKDREARFHRASKRFCDFFGLSIEDIIGKTDLDLFPKEVAKQTYSEDLHIIKTRTPLINKEESAGGVWVLTTKMPWFDKEGNILGLFGISRDITERKHAEETLKESEQNLIKGQEIGQMGYWRLNPVTQEVEGSDELFRIFELGHDELTLNAFADVVHPEDREYDLEHIQRGMEKGAPWDIEHRLLLKNGNIKWVRAIGEPHLDENGKVIHVMGIVQDITERKKAEEALQESEARYRTFVENSLQGVWQIDEMGITTFASPRMGEILGYSPNEMFGKPFSGFMDEAARKEAEVFFAKKKAGVSEVLDFRFIHKTGRDVYTTSSTVAYMDKGTFSGAVAYVTDITERKQAEVREKQLQQELILSSRLATVGEMASGIAHEINNPLTGVMGFSDLLMKKELPDDIRKDVNIIHEGGKRIASITDRMLTFAHQHEPERTSVNINEIMETTLTMRAYEMKSSNIEVASELAPDIPLTFADAGQLQQVFLNIILNAEVEMKLAHGRGNLTVKTEKIDNTIRASFKDDGPGISKKNLGRLFDPFFTTRDPDKGTGLGLSICYSIVTQHGGKIYARSRLGKGATFFVELPVVTKEEQLKMAEPAAELPRTLSRARILVVDDDAIVQEFLTTILTEEGHQVEIVENGDDALERVDSEDYDVILLDIKLPGMSGIELYRYMQKTAKSLARRVVFITGDTMSTDTMDFLVMAGAPYIAKPFDAEQLKKDIDRILSQQS